MTKLYQALTREAQDELVRDLIVELVTVAVRAVPDPDQPDDRLTMTIVAEVKNGFASGQPSIDAGLASIRECCDAAGDDLSVKMEDALLVALNRRRKEIAELRAGKIGGHPVAYLSDPEYKKFMDPILASVKPEVTLWCAAWTAGMDDDGKMVFDCEDNFSESDSMIGVLNIYDESIYAEDRDGAVRKRIAARMRKVNDVVGEIVRRLMGGE